MSNEFQYRLQKSLSDARMTAAELSEKTGISEANISNYINGKYIAKQDKCFLLAKALGVDPGWLMTGEEPRSYYEKKMQNAIPVSNEARLISGGIDRMSPERREQALKILQIAFEEFADYMKEDNTNDT